MTITVLDGHTLNPGDISWEKLAKLGRLRIFDTTDPKDTAKNIGDSEIVLSNKTPITAEDIRACPNLKYVGVLSAGYNCIDIEEARKHEIPVCNIPDYGTEAVAQFTIALLLEVCHHVGDHSKAVRMGQWSRQPYFCFWNHELIELRNKTFGVIGYGRIGRAAARMASAFGMKIIAFDKFASKAEKGTELVSFDELIRNSDVISLHCPLTKESERIISKDTIAKMKDGVIILNTARGGLVSERDIADALQTGKIKAYAADVATEEPISPNNPLLRLDNAIITPHIAWAPKGARERMMSAAADNIQAFMSGKPANVVN